MEEEQSRCAVGLRTPVAESPTLALLPNEKPHTMEKAGSEE